MKNPFSKQIQKNKVNKNVDLITSLQAIIYVRVSTESQDVKKHTIECVEYCKEKQYKIIQIFEVIASTRLSPNKRKLDLLFESVNIGDVIITTELTRLGRNVEENRLLFMELNKKGVAVEFTRVSNSILNTKSMLSGLLFEILSLFAEIERDYISERTKAGLVEAKKKALILGKKIHTGRPKGTKYLNLIGKENIITENLNNKVSLNAISRILKSNPKTLSSFIKNNKLK